MVGTARAAQRGRWRGLATTARTRVAALVVTGAALPAAAVPASAQTTSGPVLFMDATEWTDLRQRLRRRRARLDRHDSADRNICALVESRCDPEFPEDAYAVVTAHWEPGDFDRGGACYPRGCPLRAGLPTGSATEVKNIVVEAIDDTGAYGLVHNVSWRGRLWPAGSCTRIWLHLPFARMRPACTMDVNPAPTRAGRDGARLRREHSMSESYTRHRSLARDLTNKEGQERWS